MLHNWQFLTCIFTFFLAGIFFATWHLHLLAKGLAELQAQV
jgi:hypothetical protein